MKAELFLLRKIVEDKKDYAYIHFFSGQDYPIKNLQYIKDFFIANIGKEFMHYMKIPSKHWERVLMTAIYITDFMICSTIEKGKELISVH